MKKFLLLICLLPAPHLFAGDSVSVDEMKFQLMQKQVDAQQQQLEEKKNEIETLMQHHQDAMDSKLAIYTAIFLGVLGIASWLLNWLGKKEVRDIASEIANKKVEEELKAKLSQDIIDKKIETFARPLINTMITDANKEINTALEGVKNKAKQFDEDYAAAENKLKNLDPNASLTKEQMAAVKTVEQKSAADIKSGDSTKAVIDYLYAKALKAFDARDHVIAVNYFNDILELDPNNIDARFRRAYCFADINDFEPAKTDYEKVLELSPDFASAHYNLGLILGNAYFKKYDDAKQHFESAIKADPGFTEAYIALALLLSGEYFKDYPAAKDHYNTALKLNPDSPLANYNLAILLSNDFFKDYETAKKLYEKTIELDKGNAEAHYNLAILLNNDFFKDYNGAKQHYEKAIEINPLYGDAHFNLAVLLKTDFFKDYNNSKLEYEKVIEIEPKAADAHIGIAYLFKDNFNDAAKAKELYLEAVELDGSQKTPARDKDFGVE